MTGSYLRRFLFGSALALGLVPLAASGARAACSVDVSMVILGAHCFAAQFAAAVDEATKNGCAVTTADGQNDLTKQIGDVDMTKPITGVITTSRTGAGSGVVGVGSEDDGYITGVI